MPWKKPKSSNEATLNFISSLLTAKCAFAHALFIVVLARDLGAASGTSFDAASCATCGENARKSLDRLIPPTGGRGRAAQELNKEGARLRLLARLADPLIKERLGSLARFAFPFQQHLQYHEHLCCEHQQQSGRADADSDRWLERPRRCHGQLRAFFKAVIPLYFVEAAREGIAGKLGCLEDTGDIIDDAQLLDALRHQFPWAKTGAGWRRSLLDSLQSAKRVRRG